MTSLALDFLADRNPLDDYFETRADWVITLMRYNIKKGNEAIQALAGFYCWMLDNKPMGEKRTHDIRATFSHDIGGMEDKWCQPRSMPYLEIWEQEIERRGWISNNK